MKEGPSSACCQSPESHIRFHRSWRSIIPGLCFAFVLTALVLWLSQSFGIFGAELQIKAGERSFGVTLPIFLLFCLVFIARPLLLLFDCYHEIKCHHLLSVNGIYSIRKEQIEIPYEDVLGVRISQTLLDRALRVGTVLVWTAVADRPEITMHGIGDPQYYARLIQNKVDEALIARKTKQVKTS